MTAVTNRVLLVEDEADTAASMRAILEQAGYDVVWARDGGQAHSSFRMYTPDFVVLDLILPGESGFEICERMKQVNEQVPILVVTAIELADSRKLAERVGANGYLVKPVDPDILLRCIEEISERVWAQTHVDGPRTSSVVRFRCGCGRRFRVSSSHRGKALTCPSCGEGLMVPRHD